ncbi:MAG: amino acid adenylation domain-containing protein, partial [Candidatus Binatia bacterium]
KAGGAYVPLDPACPKERLAFTLEDSQVPVLLTQERLVSNLPPHNAKVAYLDTSSRTNSFDDSQAEKNPVNEATADNLAYVIYTSGSTGKPKGVQITHDNVTRLFQATDPWFHFDQNDIWTLFHSYAFDFSVWEMWGALLYGGQLTVIPHWVSRSPETFYNLLRKKRVTVLNMTPSAFRQLIQAEEQSTNRHDLALRLVILGGEALDFHSLKPWFDRHGDKRPQLINMYGITETTVHVTYYPITETDAQSGLGSVIGQPIPDLELYVLDQHRMPVPIGVPGELHVGGPGVARGYLNRPELTAERFITNPFGHRKATKLYRSGDLVRYLDNGDIEYLSRIDAQIKIRGFRVEPAEIEANLKQHPAISEAVVIAREDVPGDKRLVAYFVSKQELQPTVTDLRNFLKQKLPDYMMPSVFVPLVVLPLTPNGKVDRRTLPTPDQTRPDLEKAFVAPRTPVEEVLAGIWREILGLEQVGIYDNFFHLGGHSLLATRVISRVFSTFQVELPLRTLFEKPTVEELAEVITQNQAKKAGQEDLARMLAEIEPLSEEEAQKLLASEST